MRVCVCVYTHTHTHTRTEYVTAQSSFHISANKTSQRCVRVSVRACVVCARVCACVHTLVYTYIQTYTSISSGTREKMSSCWHKSLLISSFCT